MLTHIKELVALAKADGYALGSFNVHGLESVIGTVEAAKQECSPAIIQVSESTIDYIGLPVIVAMLKSASERIAPHIPLALHLDHGRSFESAKACIDAGFSSVHIDGSHLDLEGNIALTREVVAYAHERGIWVQGEIGAITGGHGEVGGILADVPIADPDEVTRLAKETGIDTIAAAIGTAHGVYANEDVKIEVLKAIKERVALPFVLHGGSGVPEAKIKEALRNGVDIINIGSDIKIAFAEAIKQSCQDQPEETDPRKLLAPTIPAIVAATAAAIRLVGSNGRIR